MVLTCHVDLYNNFMCTSPGCKKFVLYTCMQFVLVVFIHAQLNQKFSVLHTHFNSYCIQIQTSKFYTILHVKIYFSKILDNFNNKVSFIENQKKKIILHKYKYTWKKTSGVVMS